MECNLVYALPSTVVKLNRCWSQGMDEHLHPTLLRNCDYITMPNPNDCLDNLS